MMTWKDLKDLKDLRWKDFRSIDKDDILERFGLEERTPVGDFFSGLGLFAVGVLVGAGLGILFAPKPGVETRSRVTEAIRSRNQRATDELGAQLGMEHEPATGRIS
jgi:hypothetical protein